MDRIVEQVMGSSDVSSAPPPAGRAETLRLADATEDPEDRLLRHGYVGVAAAISIAYFAMLWCYWAPAPGRPGIDENGYLVGAKNLADHGTTGFTTSHPLEYVGAMWIRTPDGRYFPKYPVGTSLLQAIPILVGGPSGRPYAFLVSPVCTAIAVLGMFFLTRAVAGSFAGVLGMLILGFTPTTLQLAHVPSSHAPDLCFVVWGMYCLIAWARSGRLWFGIPAGLLLGFAVSIRYSDGLLGLPLGVACLLMVRWKQWRMYVKAALPVLAWAVPVGGLALFNWLTMQSLSGYDMTNESTGFTYREFQRKWEFTAQQLYMHGLFFLAPLGVAGMAMLFRRSWRIALIMVLWFVPSALLYASYYWGQQIQGTGYLRFFLVLFPAVIAAGLWLIQSAGRGGASWRGGSVASPLAAGLVAAAAVATGAYVSLGDLERQQRANLNLSFSAQTFLRYVPGDLPANRRPLVFADETMFPQLLQYLQFMGDCRWFASDVFRYRMGGGFGFLGAASGRRRGEGDTRDADNPVLIQPERVRYVSDYYKGFKNEGEIAADQVALINKALDEGREVWAVVSLATGRELRKRVESAGLTLTQRHRWTEPVADLPGRKPGALSPSRQFLDMFDAGRPKTWYIAQIERKASQESAGVAK